ncbi:MAG: Gfo/Idh/MocA family oxidoreductase [Actinomycetota bacterium]|nr:Gfo/Idh/MocA family oxidoreductase [Actinomycetota bacterium]
MTVRAAVIGCGDISAVHLAALEAMADVELVAVADTETEARSAAENRWHVPSFPDHRTLLDAIRPDVVHVCTPHDQHADPVVDALAAGVDVVMEKPVAHTVAEAERVAAAAAAHPERVVAVCLQSRYNATAQHVRGLLDSGELGAVLGGAATVIWHRTPEYYAAKPWRGQRQRSGGGVLINQAIHTLDLLQWLVGDVSKVEGRCGTYALAGIVDVEDTASVVLDHASGARSVLFATVTHVADAPVTLDLVTERARLSIRGDLTITWEDGRVEVVPERRATSVGRDYWGVSHELLIADAYRTGANGGRFWIGPAEALAAQRILAEVYALSGV